MAATQATPPEPTGRPPVDAFWKEAIFDRKCYGTTNSSRLEFLNWCMKTEGKIRGTCIGIAAGQGGGVECEFDGAFRPPQIGPWAALQFMTPEERDHILNTTKFDEKVLTYQHRCSMGGSSAKDTVINGESMINKRDMQKISLFCTQELYGAPYNLPWWLIVVIVLGILGGLAAATLVFWKVWLRDKLKNRNDKLSAFYTSSPFDSSMGAGPSGAGPSALSQHGSQNQALSRNPSLTRRSLASVGGAQKGSHSGLSRLSRSNSRSGGKRSSRASGSQA